MECISEGMLKGQRKPTRRPQPVWFLMELFRFNVGRLVVMLVRTNAYISDRVVCGILLVAQN